MYDYSMMFITSVQGMQGYFVAMLQVQIDCVFYLHSGVFSVLLSQLYKFKVLFHCTGMFSLKRGYFSFFFFLICIILCMALGVLLLTEHFYSWVSYPRQHMKFLLC